MIFYYIKKFLQFINRKPYLIFFGTIYLCLITKYYIEYKINLIYKEEKLLKTYNEELQKLNDEYEEEVYHYLKNTNNE
jgi:hypothetical protein